VAGQSGTQKVERELTMGFAVLIGDGNTKCNFVSIMKQRSSVLGDFGPLDL
jgi:hypothetical protein